MKNTSDALPKDWKELLKEKVKNLPELPGIYKHKNKEQEVIYVGKAKNLKRRVNSYFLKNHPDLKTRRLVSEIRDFEFIVVDSEIDALLLENNLIKQHKPHYNILLKDGKTYPYICITKEPFPRVFSTRQTQGQDAEYYGPYTHGRMQFALLELIKKHFQIRSCTFALTPKNIKAKRYKLCLEYHLKNCKGPCEGLQTLQDYLGDIDMIRSILKGKLSLAKQYFKEKMQEAAQNLAFEKAQRYKMRLEALSDYQAKSLVTNPSISDLEVYCIETVDDNTYLNYLRIEDGCIIQAQNEIFKKKIAQEDADILPQIIFEYRNRFASEAKRIITNVELEYKLPNIECSTPKIGDLKGLLELSIKNLDYFRRQELRRKTEQKDEKALAQTQILETLQKDLSLPHLPHHIECFDNSNLHGTNAVAGMVCFKNGQPSKKDYRKFNIKTVVGIDDFASMYEIVHRRYKRLKEESLPLPNLIIVDGGKGQLASAVQALKDLNLYGQIPIISIAKRLEEIYYPEDSFPIAIGKKSSSLLLIQRIRDETHRFAITFHRDKRSSNSFQSVLEDIHGLGKQSLEKLFTKYKSLKKIKAASAEELHSLIGKQRTDLLLAALESE
ncbi:MAG: excinuclease ABC subunit C [Cytophagales bacterium]|nr:MAG: excinuclease ABC subunit C [Cytophagales bacterium]TAF62063.1 MAG: excinuclease ABC subunit C [Cytophagales bacterium]